MTRRFSALPSRNSRPACGPRGGFTLVELLVVITIIAMLVGLLVPAVMAARNAARKTQCMNNQQQLGKGILQYVTTKEKFPPLFSLQPNLPTGATPLMAVGWVPPILPYIEQNPLYTQFQNYQLHMQLNGAQVEMLTCPSRTPGASQKAPLDYVVNAGAQDNATLVGKFMDFQENGVFFDTFTPTRADIAPAMRVRTTPPIDLAYLSNHDGTKSTIMLAETTDALDWYQFINNMGETTTVGVAPTGNQPLQPGAGQQGRSWWNAITWWQPTPADLANASWGMEGVTPTREILNVPAPPALPMNRADRTSGRPASNHSGGFHVSYCDGHTQFMSEDIEYRVYCLLMSPDSQNAKLRPTSANPDGTPVVYPTNWLVNGVGSALKALNDAEINK
jgi:prepilin-type N-terminal cleavage/methylation domain-containing protein/prepilin-type processing-associated H-X9-DG protein